jgi:tetratricopeptide (TPR) repeat protein
MFMNIEQSEMIDARQHAADLRPTDPALFVALGDACFAAGDTARARVAYERAIALDPDNWAAHNAVGHVYYRLDLPEESATAYERAIAIDPRKEHPYYGLAILQGAKLGKFAEAHAVLARGLAAIPGSAWLTDTLGANYARSGQIERALEVLEASLKTAPGNAFARGWVSMLFLQQRRYADCIAVCVGDPAYAASQDGQRTMGYAYMHLGETAEAVAHLREAVALEPDDYEARGALAVMCRAQGHKSEAAEHERIARDQAARDDAYGQACYAAVTGDTTEAITQLTIALREHPPQRSWANLDPELTFVAHDPRFQALVR